MSRRVPAICLLFAWLCASGSTLDIVQVFAWTRMFVGYARTEAILPAARETFDPAKPCEICRAVKAAREATERHSPAVPATGAEKIVLFLERPAHFLAASEPARWPLAPSVRNPARTSDVPVPPPRIAA